MDFTIEAMAETDAAAVLAIYADGLATGLATFETAVPPWDIWQQKHHASCRLVARSNAGVMGWAALSPVSLRPVYRGVAEVSIYIAKPARGQGVGKRLLQALVTASETAGFWTLQASLFPENRASLAIHISNGFRIVGRRERIAQLDGVWRDTLLLERRSKN